MKINKFKIFFLGLISGFLIILILIGTGLFFRKVTFSLIDKIDPDLKKDFSAFNKISSAFNLSFESEEDLNIFDVQNSGVELSSDYPTHGKKSLLVEFPPNTSYPGIFFELPKNMLLDWRGMKEFSIDIFNKEPVKLRMIIQIRSGENYPKREFKKVFDLSPQAETTLIITKDELSKKVDLDKISHMTIFVDGNKTTFRVYINNMRVVKKYEE